MKKLFLIIAIAICMGAITAKGKDRLEKTVQVTQFDKVSLTAGFVVKYTQGLNHECTIFASPKDMEHVKAEVKNNQLYLSVIIDKKKMKKMKYSTSILSEDVIVYVTSPELVKASCVGSGEFIATTDIKSEDVKFDISGTGEIKLKKVTADNMTLNIAGALHINPVCRHGDIEACFVLGVYLNLKRFQYALYGIVAYLLAYQSVNILIIQTHLWVFYRVWIDILYLHAHLCARKFLA